MNSVFFFSALGILLWFIALLYLKSYIRRRTGAEQMIGKLREEMRLIEAEIDLKTDQNLGLLEEQIHVLRELARTTEELRLETEKRIAVYVRELDRRNVQDAAFAALDGTFPSSRPPPSPAPGKTSPRAEKPVSRRRKAASGGRGKKDSLLDSVEIRETGAARAIDAYKAQSAFPVNAAPETERPPPSAAPKTPQPDARAAAPEPPPEAAARPRFVRSANPITPKAPPLRERVAELYRAGFSEDLIAVRLGITVTEARLYVAMAAGGPQA